MNRLTWLVPLAGFLSLGVNVMAGIEAAAAAVEITPAASLRMAGFASRQESAKGTMSPLFLRAFVLRSDHRSVGFVVYDLIGTLGRSINEQLAAELKSAVGLGEVIFLATHTHSGPRVTAADKSADLPVYEKEVYAKTVRALKEAWNNLEPVRVGAGHGSVDINYNRIRRLPDGRVKMIWENPGKEPLGPVEATVYVVKFESLSGQTKFLLVNYACHPVILGSDNLLYSPDFPGMMCQGVADSDPNRPQCIFINGACGDMNPYFADENARPEERVREVGAELAREVLRVADSIETQQTSSPFDVTSKRLLVSAQGRWDLREWAKVTGDGRRNEEIDRMARKMEKLDLPLSLVLLTREIGFVGLPGEFFSRFQTILRESAPVQHLIVGGYANETFGYFPTIEAAALGGYGANDTATFVAPGTGERIVTEALVGLNELVGLFRPVPSSADSGYQK